MTDPDRVRKQARREPWVKPVIVELPPLTELTLQSGGGGEGGDIGGGGNTGGSGSTVF
jgi:hypothetical protein